MGPALKSAVSMLSVLMMVMALASATDVGNIQNSPMDFPVCLASCGQQIMQCGNQCALQGPTMGGLLCIAFCSNQNLMCAGACTGHDFRFPPTFAYPPPSYAYPPIHT